eukprot:gene33577-16518_t
MAGGSGDGVANAHGGEGAGLGEKGLGGREPSGVRLDSPPRRGKKKNESLISTPDQRVGMRGDVGDIDA